MTADTPAAAPITAERDAYKWAYEYLQSRMESIDRHGWAHDCDGEIEDRIKAAALRSTGDLSAEREQEISRIEDTIARGDMPAALVFTKMRYMLRAALSAPVAAPPVDPLLGQALQALVRYANAFDADAKTVAVIQALEERIDGAPPAASGVDARWVEEAMKLATRGESAYLRDFNYQGDDKKRIAENWAAYKAAREALRTHLSTALTGAAKD